MARFPVFLVLVSLASIALAQVDSNTSSTDDAPKLDLLTTKHADYIPDYKLETLRKLQERLIRYRRLLAAAEANKDCLTARDNKLYHALNGLEAVRTCIYSGLPHDYYYALKESCHSLPHIKDKVDHIYEKCEGYSGRDYHKCRSTELLPARAVVHEIKGRCKRISLGPYGPKNCHDIEPLEETIDALRKTDCGTGVYTYKEIVAAIKDITAKIKHLLNGAAIPSNDPRYYNVPV